MLMIVCASRQELEKTTLGEFCSSAVHTGTQFKPAEPIVPLHLSGFELLPEPENNKRADDKAYGHHNLKHYKREARPRAANGILRALHFYCGRSGCGNPF